MNLTEALLDAKVQFPAGPNGFLPEDLPPGLDAEARLRDRDFLAVYFKEMSALSILEPEEERSKAREIERRELAFWRKAFRFRPLAETAIRLVELYAKESPKEFRDLRAELEHSNNEEALGQVAERAAHKARILDVDRQLQVLFPEQVLRLAAKASDKRTKLSLEAHAGELSRLLERAQRVKNDFVKANLRLVVGIARRFHKGRMPLSDLIQEGNIGLIKAVERFDYRRGYRFSTYASWWIRHAISRALADKGRAIRLPVHMIDAYGRITRSSQEIASKLGREPTTEELSKETGLPKSKIERLKNHAFSQPYSLDRPVSEEDGRQFMEFLQQEDQVNPFDSLLQEGLLTEVRKLMKGLNQMEAEILRWRFGLETDREYTLKEIGEKYNLSRERIRQLQEQALGKIRTAMRRKDLL
jgi:RNA polymerase primary sigma factor